MFNEVFDSPLFDLEGFFFFFEADLVEVLPLVLLGGTVEMGSINLGIEALVSCGSETMVCLDEGEIVLLDMVICLCW